MKKVISIILSLVLAMLMVVPVFAAEKTVEPAANAYAQYDKAKVASGDFSDLSYDQIASLIFDFIDKKIAEATADFDNFETEVYGQTVQIPVEITGIDSLLQYKDHLTELGGDFANLDASALNKIRADGDINLMYSFFEFMAQNSDVLGKVFGWTEENVFDYGKVGEYIESLDESDENNKAIKDFYHDYLLGNDIQSKFVAEIAKEMNYTIAEGEDFDSIINNGIINKVADVCGDFLSDEAIETLKGYNLKTTDIYTLVENFCALVQADKWEEVTMYYTYILDNLVRPLLKTAFGYTATVGAATAVPSEFTSVYTDLEALEEISGGNVQFQKADGTYVEVTVKNGAATGAKEVTYGESFINFEAPEVSIGDKNTVIGTYTPTNPDVTAYNPTVYTDASYADYIDEDMVAAAGEFGVEVKAEDVPEAIAAIIAQGNGTAMVDEFKMTVGAPIDQTIEITFEEIEALANAAIAEKLPEIQTSIVDPAVQAAVDTANNMKANMGQLGSFLPTFTGSVTINSVTVALAYTAYATDDTFVCEVTVTPTYDITYGGNVWDYAQYAGITKDKIQSDYIEPAVEEAIKNPVATIVVENLSGSIEGFDDVTKLMGYVDTDFDVDTSVLDFAANYDAYKGVIGQMNRVLCDITDMVLTEDGEAWLGLTKGSNANLTDNLQTICDKANDLVSTVEDVMNNNQYSDFIADMGIDVNAMMDELGGDFLYAIDFSSVEGLYVSAVKAAAKVVPEFTDNEDVIALMNIVAPLDTLDSMLVGAAEYALAKAVDTANAELDGFNYKFTAKTAEELKALDTVKKADPAKDVIMTDLVDLAFYAAEYAVPMVNDIANDLIDAVNGETGDIPHVEFKLNVQKGATWEETLTSLTDRALDLLNGLLICADEASSKAAVLDKLSVVLSAVLPMNSMLSNYEGISQAITYIFHDACAGDFEGFLSYFEVKDDAVAGDVSVTKALINASDYIVDAFFPDTVQAELYAQSETVQEEFTGELSDIAIASRNMKAVNARRANLLACAFDLLKESGTLLPYLAGATICKEHTFGQWTVVTKAGCKTAGQQERVCTVCDYKETQTIEATGHAYGEYVVTKAATCTAEGTETKTCANCGKTETKTIPAKGHAFGAYVVTKAATCTAAGTETRTCANCGKTETRSISATGHSYGAWTTKVQPTCTNEGLKTSVCAKCGDTKTESIAATGKHVDNDSNEICDTCGKDLSEKKSESFIDKITSFFKKIIDWFKNLFK